MKLKTLARFSFYRLKTVLKLYDLILELVTGSERVITKSQASHWGDRSATMQHVDFYLDPLFKEAKEHTFEDAPNHLSQQINLSNIDWRIHICTWAASHCINLEGDFVECGVWYGWLSRAMCKYVDFNRTDKTFHLFDSWGASDSHPNYQDDIYDAVKDRFSEYPNVIFHRGLVPDVLSKNVDIEKISYLSLDMNGGIAERQALNVLYNKVVKGGIIYVDDYGWDFPVLRHELREFLRDKPDRLLHFPCGSSLIVKV